MILKYQEFLNETTHTSLDEAMRWVQREFSAKKSQRELLSEMMRLDQESGLYDSVNEGGAYGHLAHPFEDIGLTMQDINDMITAAVEGAFGPENFVQEKTDGQQLSITWKDGEIRAARNKGQLKDYGKDSLTPAGVAALFAGRGDIEVAFNAAMKDMGASIRALSASDKEKYFANGRKFASIEIITPVTQNTVPYGLNMLIFHGVIEYDENGNAVGEDKQAGRDLGKLVADANAAAQETFYVRGPQDIALKPLPNTQARKSYYEGALRKLMADSGTSLSSSVEDYAVGRAKNVLQGLASRDKMDIPSEYLDALGKRVAGIDKSFTVPQIKKVLQPPVADWYINLEKSQEKELRKRVYQPLEAIFLELGTEVMKNVSSFLSANPTQAAESMRKEIDGVINKIKSSGGEDEVKKMEYELERVAAAGGLGSIVPTEGITFVYKGKIYKFTGIFAALNQIRGILAYKK
jgi:hypothetical protein